VPHRSRRLPRLDRARRHLGRGPRRDLPLERARLLLPLSHATPFVLALPPHAHHTARASRFLPGARSAWGRNRFAPRGWPPALWRYRAGPGRRDVLSSTAALTRRGRSFDTGAVILAGRPDPIASSVHISRLRGIAVRFRWAASRSRRRSGRADGAVAADGRAGPRSAPGCVALVRRRGGSRP
jgi:hypothetical protein